MVTIREETPEDADAIRTVNVSAFGGLVEAGLVDTLRTNCPEMLSLVAVVDGRLVGHIMFTPATIAGDGETIAGMGLAPMAVLPEHQRQGIGTALVGSGLKRLAGAGCPFVIVLGHPRYYPRFGFEPAIRRSIRSEWDVPNEAFMILMLDEARMRGFSGVARYRPEFADAL